MAQTDIVIKIKGDSKDFDKEVRGAQRELDRANKSAKGLQISMDQVKIAAAAGFAAISAAAVSSVKAFAQFDDELRGVKTLLDQDSFGAKGLEKGFKDMTSQVKELGKRVPVDLGAVNKALFDTVSAGVAAGDAVGVVEISAKLAVAGLTDVSVATDGMTSALNAYELGAEDAEEVASKFFAAQKAGKTTIAELSSGFGLVGANAKSFGVSLDELLASVSAMTSGSIKTNAAFTGLKALLTSISKPTADAAAEAKRLGIEFNSTALRSKGLKGFLDSITKSVNFNSTSFEKLLGSSEAQTAAFSLTGAQAELFAKTIANLGNKQKTLNTLSEAYVTQSASAKNQLKLAENNVKLLSIAIGEGLIPQVLLITKYWTDFIKSFSTSVEALNATELSLGEINKRIDEAEPKLKKLNETISKVEGSNFYTGFTGDIKAVKLEAINLEQDLIRLRAERANKLKAIQEKEVSDRNAASEKELADKLAAETLIADQVAAKKQAALEAANAKLEENRTASFENELAKTQENATLLSDEEYVLLQENIKKQQKAKDLAAAQELKKQGKHDQAMKKLRDIQNKEKVAAYKANIATQEAYTNASLQLANNLQTLSVAISGKQNMALFVLQKAAAIAQAYIATNLAAAKALAVGGPGLQALTYAAGYTNIAAIAATTIKGFQDGGIVGGNSFSGDNVPARVNSGEMILNRDQQAELFALANGGGNAGGSEIVLTLKDNLVDFIEAEIIERRSLGEATI